MVDRLAGSPPPDWRSDLLDDPLLEPWREQLAGLDDPWPAGPTEIAEDPLDLPPPPPPSVVADLLADPGSRRWRRRNADDAGPAEATGWRRRRKSGKADPAGPSTRRRQRETIDAGRAEPVSRRRRRNAVDTDSLTGSNTLRRQRATSDTDPIGPHTRRQRATTGTDLAGLDAWWRQKDAVDTYDSMDTRPLALVPLPREAEQVLGPLETPPRGLRKFDLGTVPASVTPPRTWRKAAWFAVGTSAAVVCGLAIAAVRLVGPPWPGETIDALPAYPTRSLELDQLPVHETSEAPTSSSTPRRSLTPSDEKPDRTGSAHPAPSAMAAGSPADEDITSTGTPTVDPAGQQVDAEDATAFSVTSAPERTTVGPVPVTPTAPQAMGDRTEQYYALVTEDPRAAHELCTGGLAQEGPEGIKKRYQGVERVEVQKIIIDRNHAVTTSTVKVVYQDGRATIEERQLTFTWGGDPKISDETVPV